MRKRCGVNFLSRILWASILLYLIVLAGCKGREEAVSAPPKSFMTNSLFKIFFVDMKNGWAVGKLGKIVHTYDRGKVWETQNSGTDCNLRGVYFLNDQVGWTVGDRGTILHTSDGGRVWVSQASGTDHHLRDVFFLNETQGWIVGEQGVLLYCNDGGKQWKEREDLKKLLTVEESPFLASLFAIDFVDEKNGWIVGDYGTILRTTDGGQNWEKQKSGIPSLLLLSGTFPLLMDVKFIDPLKGWAVGESGTILHTSDGGNTWKIQESGISYLLNGVTFTDGLNGWVIGYGTILHATDGGKHWEVQVADKKMWLYGIHSEGKENIWVSCDFGEILYSSDGGKNWTEQLPVE